MILKVVYQTLKSHDVLLFWVIWGGGGGGTCAGINFVSENFWKFSNLILSHTFPTVHSGTQLLRTRHDCHQHSPLKHRSPLSLSHCSSLTRCPLLRAAATYSRYETHPKLRLNTGTDALWHIPALRTDKPIITRGKIITLNHGKSGTICILTSDRPQTWDPWLLLLSV